MQTLATQRVANHGSQARLALQSTLLSNLQSFLLELGKGPPLPPGRSGITAAKGN